MSYTKKLIEAGISENRAYGLTSAISSLVTEICKLDLKNRREFLRISIDHRLSEFARTENTMDAIESELQDRIDQSYSMLDIDGGVGNALSWFDETGESLTDLIELRLPSAAQAYANFNKLYMKYAADHKAEIEELNENPADPEVAQITAELEDPNVRWDSKSRGRAMKLVEDDLVIAFSQYHEGLVADWECIDIILSSLARWRRLLPEPRLSWLKK